MKINHYFSCYYDSIAKTPHLNELSSEGIVYDNFFAVSPVCSPSRSSIITGMYPTTIGTQHMRAYKKNKGLTNRKTNLPIYSAVPKRKVQFFTENLRKMGYYCSNNSKEDYNMEMSPLAWDQKVIKMLTGGTEKKINLFFLYLILILLMNLESGVTTKNIL